MISAYLVGAITMSPLSFYKCLSDDTRLKSLLLISRQQEMCVCELIEKLNLSQPKVSRHLAELRRCGVLVDERRGKWVFYRLHPELPEWAKNVLVCTAAEANDYLAPCFTNLEPDQAAQGCC